MKTIAHIRTDFPTKFGVPRQSGLVEQLRARVVFEPAYRSPDALRGLEGFSHIWLIWRFSLTQREGWSATVRPPRLGGNVRLGVFATRSPFRPNPIGLSCVRLESVDLSTPEGPVLIVRGADMVDKTPILDIKPYLPFSDSHPEAAGGFAQPVRERRLEVQISPALLLRLPQAARDALIEVLAQDPRPGYQRDDERVYGMPFAGVDVRFCVRGDVLTVVEIAPPAQGEGQLLAETAGEKSPPAQ